MHEQKKLDLTKNEEKKAYSGLFVKEGLFSQNKLLLAKKSRTT
jgi:hypothetical protein